MWLLSRIGCSHNEKRASGPVRDIEGGSNIDPPSARVQPGLHCPILGLFEYGDRGKKKGRTEKGLTDRNDRKGFLKLGTNSDMIFESNALKACCTINLHPSFIRLQQCLLRCCLLK